VKLATQILAVTTAAALLAGCGARRARVIVPKIGTTQNGIASWYGDPYHGRRAASGEIYDMEKWTAAHRRFAFGTCVRVFNLDNGRVTVVRINDRGPFKRGRIIDLSRAAGRAMEMIGPGTARVRVVVIPALGGYCGP
jgi:rare lipoprotein A